MRPKTFFKKKQIGKYQKEYWEKLQNTTDRGKKHETRKC